jgi:CRP-like cAMP-binding protein
VSAETRDLLATHPLWDTAPRELRELAATKMSVRRLRVGARVLSEGDPADAIHLLVDGCVRVFYATSDQAQITVKIFRAPAMFGEAEAVSGFVGTGTVWQETVQTVVPSTVLTTPVADYLALLARAPAIAMLHFVDVCERFSRCIGSERSTHEGSLDQRVLGLLAAYAKTFGDQRGRETIIDHKLSYDSLAMELGATSRTVARAIQRLSKAGRLRRAGHRFVLIHGSVSPASERLSRIAFATRRVATK